MKKVITIRLDEEVHARLSQAAKQKEWTIGHLVRKAIEVYLKDSK